MAPEKRNFIQDLTSTTNPEGQLLGLTALYETAQAEFLAQLLVLAPKDLTAYSEYMHPDEPPALCHVFMLQKLMELDEGFIPRLMLSAPPGHAKSTYASRDFPTWRIGKHPKTKYLQAGHSQTFVENEFGKKCRDIIESEAYREIFPDVQLSNASRAAGYWLVNNGSSYLTRGVGQGIAGFRTNLCGIDDPFATREDAESPTIRDKTYNWYKADILPRLLPKCSLFIVATRWHSDDLCGRLEEESKLIKDGMKDGVPWEIINLPAIYNDDSVPDPLGRKLGDALWPDFYTKEILANIKADQSAKDWNSLYMGRPVDEEGGVINPDWFRKERRYKIGPDRIDVRRRVMSVDTANKDTERSAYTVITIWDETKDKHHYLIHVLRKRLEYTDLVSRIKRMSDSFDVDAILIEDKGSGIQFIQQQNNPATQITHLPVIGIQTDQKTKEFRMDGVTPFMEAGLVHLPESASWLPEYEAELFGWPNTKYQDQGDATSQYLAWARPKRIFGTKKIMGSGYNGKTARVRAEIEAQITNANTARLGGDGSVAPTRNYIGVPTHNIRTAPELEPLDVEPIIQVRRKYGGRRLH